MTNKLPAYLTLTKPRIVIMVGISALVGFALAGGEVDFASPKLLAFLMGTALCGAGGAALNNFLEGDLDARMARTARRPIPSGIISPAQTLAFGVCLLLCGLLILNLEVNLLCAFLALLSAFLYIVVYTPLKRVTWLNTAVGAIPGALPPVGGWAAAQGSLQLEAWLLFLILFFWQFPHFYAIAWIYKEDYARAGFKMLPVLDVSGRRTMFQILLFSALLIIASLLPCAAGLCGPIYFFGALALGLMMLLAGLSLAKSHSVRDARGLLRASLFYWPVLLLMIVGELAYFS